MIRTALVDLSFEEFQKVATHGKDWSGSAFTIASPEAYIFTNCLLRACHDLCIFLSYNISLSLSLSFCVRVCVCVFCFVLRRKSIRAFRTSSFIWRVSFIHLPRQHWMVHFCLSILLSRKLLLLLLFERFPPRRQSFFLWGHFLHLRNVSEKDFRVRLKPPLGFCSMKLSHNFSCTSFYMTVFETKSLCIKCTFDWSKLLFFYENQKMLFPKGVNLHRLK